MSFGVISVGLLSLDRNYLVFTCNQFSGTAVETKFIRVSKSELYGKIQDTPRTEDTPIYARSPYVLYKWSCYGSNKKRNLPDEAESIAQMKERALGFLRYVQENRKGNAIFGILKGLFCR